MGRPQLYTKNGHSMYDMVSLLQKAIRRGDAEVAGYAANERSVQRIPLEKIAGNISRRLLRNHDKRN